VRFALIAAVTLLLIITVSAASAEPYVSVWEDEAAVFSGTASWFGQVGLIITPTAETPPASGAAIEFHRIQREIEDVDVWGATFGVTDWLEAGGAVVGIPGGDDETVGNVKVRIPAAKWLGNSSFPDVAVGAFDVTDQLNRALYLVLSTTYKFSDTVPGINLHLGLADNKTNSGSLDGLFGGIEFSAMRFGTVQAEYDGQDFNAAFRYRPSNRITLDLGTLGGDFGYGATYHSQF
jgi:hypothetical protein